MGLETPIGLGLMGTGSQRRGLEPSKISGPNSKDLGMSGFRRGKN